MKTMHEIFIEGLLAMGVHMEHPDAKALHEARLAEKVAEIVPLILPVGLNDLAETALPPDPPK